MSKPIKTRLEALERETPKGDHEYDAVIEGFGDTCTAHYYRDGVEISQAEYFREAPKDQEIVINWGDPIPPRESTD